MGETGLILVLAITHVSCFVMGIVITHLIERRFK